MSAPTTPAPVPTSQPPCMGGDVEALVPGVWAPGTSDAAVQWALDGIEDYCNRHFAKQTGHQVRLDPEGFAAMLPDPPVSGVSLVEAYIRDVTTRAAAWQTLVNWEWTPDGQLYDTSACPSLVSWAATWPSEPMSLRVTYDHGFDVWPTPVISAVKQLAAMFLVNPTGMSEQRTAETMRRWLTGGATAGGTSSGGQAAGGIQTANALDRLVLVEV